MAVFGTSAGNLLLTGPPGSGKTTVVLGVIERLGDCRLAGFYTREIREGGQRRGFEAVGLGGRSAVLAHVGIRSPFRVGHYRVDVAGFEAIVRAELGPLGGEVDLVIIDEIGKMECFSGIFVEAVERLLDGPAPVLATVAARGGGLIARAKARSDVEVVRVAAGTRDDLPAVIAGHFRHLRLGPGRR